ILDQSFGVITYQDDVMLIAIHLAGYSWLEADKLRKAMGKKIPAEMRAQKEKLFTGFIEHGLSKKKADELWHLIEPFAAYGFNKAHAASYGRVAYQTAYMKANFPVAYMTAILTNESGDIEKISEIVSECKRMGITVLPPDVNVSEGGFSISESGVNGKEEIRFGLYTIKNLGTDIADAIINERIRSGPFTSFENFIVRIEHKNLNRKSLESLTKCGALDSLGERGEILANIDSILEFHKKVVKDNASQGTLFGASHVSFSLKKSPPASKEEKLSWEKELLGLFVSGFPLDPWKEKIEARKISINTVHSTENNRELSIPAIIEKIRITTTKKGDKMALVTIRDYTSALEVAVFPETYKRHKDLIVLDKPLVFKGKVSSRNNEKTFVVDVITPLS
ncbi:MAG: polymerase subunit alpha, partial [Patescibacteria group bacterium]|nr:polymerase subunit alpha [Patescibacteria group bacterium]